MQPWGKEVRKRSKEKEEPEEDEEERGDEGEGEVKPHRSCQFLSHILCFLKFYHHLALPAIISSYPLLHIPLVQSLSRISWRLLMTLGSRIAHWTTTFMSRWSEWRFRTCRGVVVLLFCEGKKLRKKNRAEGVRWWFVTYCCPLSWYMRLCCVLKKTGMWFMFPWGDASVGLYLYSLLPSN